MRSSTIQYIVIYEADPFGQYRYVGLIALTSPNWEVKLHFLQGKLKAIWNYRLMEAEEEGVSILKYFIQNFSSEQEKLVGILETSSGNPDRKIEFLVEKYSRKPYVG